MSEQREQDRSRPGSPAARTSSARPDSRSQNSAVEPPAVARQREVGDERAGQAGDDHDLLHARQPAADRGRRHLGDVDRREHAGRADAQAADDAREDEDAPSCRAAPAQQRADQEQHRGDHHHAAPADQVGQPPGGEGADRAADQDRADVEADAQPAEVERASSPFCVPLMTPEVIAEHEAADRRHRDDRGDEARCSTRVRATCCLPSRPPPLVFLSCFISGGRRVATGRPGTPARRRTGRPPGLGGQRGRRPAPCARWSHRRCAGRRRRSAILVTLATGKRTVSISRPSGA